MTVTPDILFEREKLKNKIKKWQWLFFILLFVLVLMVNKNFFNTKVGEGYIARISIDGLITYDSDLIKKLDELANDSKVKALIVDIDSHGSTSFAGEELYYALKDFGYNKPIVAVLKTMAASGGYMVALGAEHIIARNMTLTGSIGVLLQSFEAVELANKLGIKFISVKSSPLKVSPNPMEVMSREVQEAISETIEDDYLVFVDIVAQNRKMTWDEALKLADGRVYSGLKAKELNLIDEIGGEKEALNWLEKEKNISRKTKIEDINWGESDNLYNMFTAFFSNINSIFKSDLIQKITTKSNVKMLTVN